MEAVNVSAVVEPIVSGVVEPIVSAVVKELGNMIKKEVSLLIGVEKEVKKLHSKFKAIQAVLVKAGRKQLTDETIRDWLGKIKDVAYEVEDILDEWRIDALISQREKDDIGNQRKYSELSMVKLEQKKWIYM